MKKTAKGGSKDKPKNKKNTDSSKPVGKERQIPDKIVPTKLGDYLEIMTIAVFQAGMNWALIQNKWNSFRVAFANFDPGAVSKFKQSDIDRLMEDSGIIRSEKKIRGTIENARLMLELESEFGSFQKYLRSFETYEELSADIQTRFNFVGELSVYYLLFRVGEPVPPFEKWSTTIEGHHPRMREMVEKYANAP